LNPKPQQVIQGTKRLGL